MPLSESHSVFPYLRRLSDASGWHFEGEAAIQVGRNAKSYRSPVPRLDPKRYPLRSTFGCFDLQSGFSEWRVLEEQVPFQEMANSQAPIGVQAGVLITIYQPMPLPTRKKNEL